MSATGRASGRPSVIVTGGSSGIGLATAKIFAADGYHVALVARDVDKLARAHSEVDAVRESGEQVVRTASADLSDFEETRRALESLRDEDFAPSVLVNSAGIIVPGEFLTMSPEAFASNFDHGFWSLVYPTRVVAPWMVERGRGHIVNVASAAGFLGIYGYTGYAAAKYAVMGFSEALRSEMKPHGVKVSVVCPPDTETPGLEAEKKLRPRETDVIAGNIKPIAPEAVASAILRAVDTGRYLVIPDRMTALYFRAKGIAPEIFHSVVDSGVTRARRGTKPQRKEGKEPE